VPWEQSKAAKLMRANKIPRVDRNGRVLEDTVMDRLHHSYRARMDKDGPVKLETPITRDSATDEGNHDKTCPPTYQNMYLIFNPDTLDEGVTLWSEGSGSPVYERPVYGPLTNGPTVNGPTANGPTENGPPVRPSARPTENGQPVRPSARPTENGPTENGPTEKGPTANGPKGTATVRPLQSALGGSPEREGSSRSANTTEHLKQECRGQHREKCSDKRDS
jgi:hypothetical protein